MVKLFEAIEKQFRFFFFGKIVQVKAIEKKNYRRNMTAPNDAEDRTPVRRSILANLSNTGYMVNIVKKIKLFYSRH